MDSLRPMLQPLGNDKIILSIPDTRPQSNKNSIKFSGQQQHHQSIHSCLLLARTINEFLSPGLLHVPFTVTWPLVRKKKKVITSCSIFHVSTPWIPKAVVCVLPLKWPQYVHVCTIELGRLMRFGSVHIFDASVRPLLPFLLFYISLLKYSWQIKLNIYKGQFYDLIYAI